MIRVRSHAALVLLALASVMSSGLSAQGSTATVRVNLPVTDLVATLSLSTDLTDFGTIPFTDLTTGYSATQGPMVTVRANHSFTVLVSAPNPFVAPDPKPVSDMMWSSQGDPFVGMATLGAELVSSSTGASLSRPVDFRVLWGFSSDPPGDYSLRVDFTLQTGG